MELDSVNRPVDSPAPGSREFAEDECMNKMEKAKLTFCPAIGKMCRNDCVCFAKPSVSPSGTSSTPYWICTGGYCDNYSLKGPI